jgi:hypothetical protein
MLHPIRKIPQLLFTNLLFFVFTQAHAQGNGQLSGKVVDRATQMPLAGISVLLQDTTKGTTTDSAGIFRFTDLDIKTYNLVLSGVGYKPQTLFNIVISAGNETNLNIEMEPSVESLSEVVIRSNRRTAAAATI